VCVVLGCVFVVAWLVGVVFVLRNAYIFVILCCSYGVDLLWL
jgi:hypothetical protein